MLPVVRSARRVHAQRRHLWPVLVPILQRVAVPVIFGLGMGVTAAILNERAAMKAKALPARPTTEAERQALLQASLRRSRMMVMATRASTALGMAYLLYETRFHNPLYGLYLGNQELLTLGALGQQCRPPLSMYFRPEQQRRHCERYLAEFENEVAKLDTSLSTEIEATRAQCISQYIGVLTRLAKQQRLHAKQLDELHGFCAKARATLQSDESVAYALLKFDEAFCAGYSEQVQRCLQFDQTDIRTLRFYDKASKAERLVQHLGHLSDNFELPVQLSAAVTEAVAKAERAHLQLLLADFADIVESKRPSAQVAWNRVESYVTRTGVMSQAELAKRKQHILENS
ncbi:MAG: hypothetical protein MHM6MM_008484 [Cercozoa sp. M6MM]